MKSIFTDGILLLCLAGCAAPPTPAPAPDRSHVPPPVEGRVPTEYTPLREQIRPDWIDTVPVEADGTHYLVGMSQHQGDEQPAREEAMRNAREEFAKYTGVHVSAIDEMSRSLYGSESAVLDATVAGSSTSQQITDAQVSRIKAWKWYVEKSRAKKGGVDQGMAYQAWVLVTVPVSEYARVQDWKEKKAVELKELKARQAADLEKLKQAAEEERQRLLEEHKRRMEGIDTVFEEGDLMRSLSLLDAEYKRLGSLADERQANGGPFVATANELRRVQKDLPGRAEEMTAGLHLDTGIFGSVCYVLPGGESKISIWGWIKGKGGNLRAPRLPLRLETAAGTVAARATTDGNGRADFSHADIPAGIYRVGIDLESAALRNLSEPMVLPLVNVESRLTIAALQQDLDGVMRGLVARLFAGPSLVPLLTKRVLLGPITYGEGGQGSEFAVLLRQTLSERLTQIPGLEVVAPRRRGVEEVARAAEEVARAAEMRGITAGKLPALGSGATQAVIDGADAALEGNYVVRGGELKINLVLKAAASDLLLATASAGLRQEQLPPGIEVLPVAGNGLAPPADFGGGSIRLEITSHLGNGQTYADGETISYFVRIDRDAYLLLIYEDAAHNLIRILPNRYAGKGLYRAGSTLQIPTQKDGFEFTVTAPFGLERVWAFAASAPFPELPGEELENGLSLLHGRLDALLAKIRGASRRGGAAYGEAQTTITTISRQAALVGR